jgi:hypothetical protein
MQPNLVDIFRGRDNFKIEVEVNSDQIQEIVSVDVLTQVIEENLEAIPRSEDLDTSVEDCHFEAIINQR